MSEDIKPPAHCDQGRDVNSRDDLREVAAAADVGIWGAALRARLPAANAASSRARTTLVVVSLLAAGLSLAMFAYFCSWNKEFAQRYQKERKEGPVFPNAVREEAIKEWLSTGTYQVPVLGLKIMASDLPLFAPIALVVASSWFVFVVRREHYTVGRLLGDTYVALRLRVKGREPQSIILAQEIYHGVIGYTVLNVIPYDVPIDVLARPMQSADPVGAKGYGQATRRVVIRGLLFLPALAVAFIAVMRALTFVTIPSAITGEVHRVQDLDGGRSYLLYASALVSVVGVAIALINGRQAHLLLEGTRHLLDEFQLWAFQGREPQLVAASANTISHVSRKREAE